MSGSEQIITALCIANLLIAQRHAGIGFDRAAFYYAAAFFGLLALDGAFALARSYLHGFIGGTP